MTDFDAIRMQISQLAAEHEARADEHAAQATQHTTEARRLREIMALIERHASRSTAHV